MPNFTTSNKKAPSVEEACYFFLGQSSRRRVVLRASLKCCLTCFSFTCELSVTSFVDVTFTFRNSIEIHAL